MNIFWLDEDVDRMAKFHCDKHVNNKCIEYAQILSTVADRHNFWDEDMFYEPIPSINPVIHDWASESEANFTKLTLVARALGREFEHRYGHKHQSIKDVVSNIDLSKINMPDKGFTDPPLCPRRKVDDYGFDGTDFVKFYRMVYADHKDWSKMWTNRDVPEWYINMGGNVRGEI